MRQGFCHFGFAHATGPGKKQYAARAATASAGLRPGEAHDRAHDNIQGLGHSALLATHPGFNKSLARGDLFTQVGLLPWIFRGAHLEALHGVIHVLDCYVLAASNLRNIAQCRQRESIGLVGKIVRMFALHSCVAVGVAGEQVQQQPGRL